MAIPASTIDWDSFARLYDDDYGDFTADLDLYLPFAKRTGGPVLEAMCGTGRVLLALADAGHNVVGLDISPVMVEHAQRKIEHSRNAGRARAMIGDVRSFDLQQQFALAIVPMNSFMHLPAAVDQARALQAIRRHLLPNGMLILDLFNPDPHEIAADESVAVHAKTFVSSAGARVQKWVLRRTDFAEQTHYVEFIYDEIGPDRIVRRDILPFTMRWLYRFELEYLLAANGFVVEGLFGSYDLDDYHSDADRLIAVARRAEA